VLVGRRPVNRVLAVLVSATALLVACERDRELPASTPTESSLVAVAPDTTSPPETDPATTTGSIATTVPGTLVAPTAPPTSPPPTEPVEVPAIAWEGDVVSVQARSMPEPFDMHLVPNQVGVTVYDGSSTNGSMTVRCVVVVHPDQRWSEGCGEPGRPFTLTYVDDRGLWSLEVGVEPGNVTPIQREPETWTASANGCADPLVQLIDAAGLVPPTMATGLACVGTEALITSSSLWLSQPLATDGGGTFLTKGAEGWVGQGGGTAIPCRGTDVDRCQTWGVVDDLFEAVTPIPSPSAFPAAAGDIVQVVNVTVEVQAMTAGAPDVEAMIAAVVDSVSPPDAELPPAIHHDVISNPMLVTVDVPAADDSIRSTTWAFWVVRADDGTPPSMPRAYAWENCARGLASPGLCV
jgi:hypothetical protein